MRNTRNTSTRVALAVIAPASALALGATTVFAAPPSGGHGHQQHGGRPQQQAQQWQGYSAGGDQGHHWPWGGGDHHHGDGSGGNGNGRGFTFPFQLPPLPVKPPQVKLPAPVTTVVTGVVHTATGALHDAGQTIRWTVEGQSAGGTAPHAQVHSGVQATTTEAAAVATKPAPAPSNDAPNATDPAVAAPALPLIGPAVLPSTASDLDVVAHLPLGWFGALVAVDVLFAALVLRRRHRLPERVSAD